MDLQTLLNLDAYRRALPSAASGDIRRTEPVTLHLSATRRLVLHMEVDQEPGHAFARNEELARHGISSARHDSKQFARAFAQAIGQDLTRRQVDDMVKALSEMWDDAPAVHPAEPTTTGTRSN